MKFCTLASGSSGNCTVVFHGNTYILIDAGISARRIAFSLRQLGIAPSALTAVFITHEHSDHIQALKTAAGLWQVPIFAAAGECAGILAQMPETAPYLNAFSPGDTLEMGELTLRSFRTPHDTPESVGYVICGGGRKLAFATDMGYLTNTVVQAVSGADAAIVESNHDVAMLKTGRYPAYLKRRILGPGGHLSNDDCGVLAAVLADHGAKTIMLAHLSHDNNTPETAFATVSASLKARHYIPKENIGLFVAPRSTMGPVLEV